MLVRELWVCFRFCIFKFIIHNSSSFLSCSCEINFPSLIYVILVRLYSTIATAHVVKPRMHGAHANTVLETVALVISATIKNTPVTQSKKVESCILYLYV